VTDPKYRARVTSIVRGIDRCRTVIETSAGLVGLTHFRNLAWNGETLERRDKPEPQEGFDDFAAYRAFLTASFAGLGSNLDDPARRFPLGFLGTLSSGFDANAATALASEAGCQRAICFETTGSGHPDSGVPVARALGIEPIVTRRDSWRDVEPLDGGTEVPFLASGGGSGVIEFHGAREHLRGSLLVTGFYGDSIWNPERARPRPLHRPQGRLGTRPQRVPPPCGLRKLRTRVLGGSPGCRHRRDRPLGRDGSMEARPQLRPADPATDT